MEKSDIYRGSLPHFHTPGQSYFVTCVLQDAVPKHVLAKTTGDIALAKYEYEQLKAQNPSKEVLSRASAAFMRMREKYWLNYDRLLMVENSHPINLSKKENLSVIEETLRFWEGRRLKNLAWCIMPNHLHWIVTIFDQNEMGTSIFLQDILHSVKLFTAKKVNQNENQKGPLWMHESFDTTIRNDSHLQKVVNYTINNPVKANIVNVWTDWPGTFVDNDIISEFEL